MAAKDDESVCMHGGGDHGPDCTPIFGCVEHRPLITNNIPSSEENMT